MISFIHYVKTIFHTEQNLTYHVVNFKTLDGSRRICIVVWTLDSVVVQQFRSLCRAFESQLRPLFFLIRNFNVYIVVKGICHPMFVGTFVVYSRVLTKSGVAALRR